MREMWLLLLSCLSFHLVAGDSSPSLPYPYFLALNPQDSYVLPSPGYRLTTIYELQSQQFRNFYVESGGIPSNLKADAYQTYACEVYVKGGWLMYPKDDEDNAQMMTLELDGKGDCSVAGLSGNSTFMTTNLTGENDCGGMYASISFPANQTTFSSLISNTFTASSTCSFTSADRYNNYSLLTLDYTPSSQVQILEELYDETGGAEWTYQDNWMTGDPCLSDWAGVSCSYSNVGGWTITSVSLYQNNMKGVLPSSLFTLPDLEILNIRNNELNGTLPSLLPSSLFSLSCSYNQLSGTFPTFSTNESLYCSHNQFSDSGIVTVGESLDMSFNLLTDLSPFYQIYNTTKHTYTFDLSNNLLTGTLPDYPIVNNKMKVHLENNFLTGDITPIGGDTVYLSNNNFNGKFVGDFLYYPSDLYVESNSLSGVIDPAICTTVSDGNFTGNDFTCPIPWCLPQDTPCSPAPFDYFWILSLVLVVIGLILIPLIFFLVMSFMCGVTFSLFTYEARVSTENASVSVSGSRLEVTQIVTTFLFAYCVLANIFSLVFMIVGGCHSTRPEDEKDICHLSSKASWRGALVASTLFFWLPVVSMIIATFFGCWCSDVLLCCDLRGWGHNRTVTFFAFASFACLFTWSVMYINHASCSNGDIFHSGPDEACELNFDRLSWMSFVLLGLGFFGSVFSILSGRFECFLAFSETEVTTSGTQSGYSSI